MRRFWKNLIAAVGVVIVLQAGALGNTAWGASLEEVRTRGVLRAGVPDFRLYPFAFSEDGHIRGFDVDLVEAIAAEAGVSLELVPLSWAGVSLAWNPSYGWDRFDLVAATISVTSERQKVCDFSIPYFTSGQTVSVLPDSGIHSLEQLHGKKIATPGGTTSEKMARTFFGDPFVVIFHHIPDCYDALLKKEVAGTVTDLATILLEPRVRNGEILVLPKTLSREWYGVALPKGEPELRELVNRVVEASKDVLYEKWIGF